MFFSFFFSKLFATSGTHQQHIERLILITKELYPQEGACGENGHVSGTVINTCMDWKKVHE